MKIINQMKLNMNEDYEELIRKVAKTLHISVNSIDRNRFVILRKSIDARDKSDIKFVYNVAVDYDNSLDNFNPIISNNSQVNVKPIVVGLGPAGLFSAYVLALNGLNPIILERGKKIEDRQKDVDKFFRDLILDENSNVCFGEGGAGAFSDGKLNTNNKDKTGVYRFVLNTFVKFGADKKILYENLPHIGTDKLIKVISRMRDEILNLGAEIHYNTIFKYSDYKDIAKTTPIVLAIGNSSRDTFFDLMNNGFFVKPKPLAIGYRVAHKQKMIDISQYGFDTKNSILSPATYKLTYDAGCGHSVYSFCMCPGGYIINSSNKRGLLSINGMSYNDRAGLYANSAIVETIAPAEIINNVSSLSDLEVATRVIEFQNEIEKKAFDLANGYIPYKILSPQNSLEEIETEKVFKGQAKKCDTLLSVYDDLNLGFNINKDILTGLSHFNKIIDGFFDDKNEMIIAGVETRTSSPIKLDRNELCECNIKNFYPCGEGLGHGGGILSSAADGVNVGMAVANKLFKNTTKYAKLTI